MIQKRNEDLQRSLTLYYTGGRGRTGTSLRTLDFEFGPMVFLTL